MSEGPFVGSRCLMGTAGPWVSATIKGSYPDGTFVVAPDKPAMSIMPDWCGVLPSEISFDDRQRWSAVFAHMAPTGRARRDELRVAIAKIGFEVDDGPMREFWSSTCAALFGTPGDDVELDEDQLYAVARRSGWCAATFERARSPWFRLYWNQTRMGGRDPADVGRPIGLADALAAIGLDAAPEDAAATAALAAFEETHGMRVPAGLAAMVGRVGAAEAVLRCHPNNPELVPITDWVPDRAGDQVTIVLVEPHQGEHHWRATWKDGDADARIIVTWQKRDGSETRLDTAPSVAFFLWDLASTGTGWYAGNGVER